jgi:RNA recognition motif-containing protein
MRSSSAVVTDASLRSESHDTRSVFSNSDVLSKAEAARTVFVGSLPRKIERSELVRYLSSVGPIKEAHYYGGSYGFVEYETAQCAALAAQLLNRTTFPEHSGVSISVIAVSIMTRLFIGGILTTLEPHVIFNVLKDADEVRRREKYAHTPPRALPHPWPSHGLPLPPLVFDKRRVFYSPWARRCLLRPARLLHAPACVLWQWHRFVSGRRW